MASQNNIVHIAPVYVLPPLKIGVFFDGTGNNNTKAEKLSNVWYLYQMHQGDGKEVEGNYKTRKFYQRGVGSHDDDCFTEAGMGAGAGKRFDNVVFYIEKYITEYREKYNNKAPNIIQIDVFGFSRGAAMARHFVNCIKQNYFDFEDPEINKAFSKQNIQINFLGIFDTVGSFGIAGNNTDNGYSFYIDPSWIEGKAVHIYALNEYRWGFDLQAMLLNQDTNYPIDIFEEKMIEIGLPGVHSDIGGGYEMDTEEQFCDNSLLACIALDVMAEYARDNGVLLNSDITDQARRDAGSALPEKQYGEMLSCFNNIKPYMEDNSLRAPIGLWREHIALADIYKHEIDRSKTKLKNLWAGEDNQVFDQLQSDLLRLEKDLKSVSIKINLNEQHLKALFVNDKTFEDFKINYDILYQNYMHRSHSPFNTTPFMGKEDADENFWIWNKTISDERPHRDIFYNSYKDFENINNKIKRSVNRKGHQKPIEFYPIQSEFWDDKNND
jgi:hypothetical protein